MKTSIILASLFLVGACASTGTGLPGRDGKGPNAPDTVDPDDDKSDDANRRQLSRLSTPDLRAADRLYNRISVEKAGMASTQVRLCVEPSGTVDTVDVVASSGLAEYDQAVVDNVASWQYAAFPAPSDTRVCENLTVAYQAK